jgi:hypothetical protein
LNLKEGVKNHKLSTFLDFVEEMDLTDDDAEFWYRMYEDSEQEEIFPLGMDEYAILNTPTLVQVGGAKFEGPTVVGLLRKFGRVYCQSMMKEFMEKLRLERV